MLFEHGRMGDAEGLLVSAGRDMDDIAVRFDHLRDFNRFFKVVAFLDKLIAGKSEFNREERTDRFSD